MKFAHEYEVALQQEGYPEWWILSAISYRQLKKCIRKVQMELSQIGLDVGTLKQLWKSPETSDPNGISLQYQLEGKLPNFEPKLIFLVNPKNGIPVDVCLSPQTRVYLQSLVVPVQNTSNGGRISAANSYELIKDGDSIGSNGGLHTQNPRGGEFGNSVSSNDPNNQGCLRIEIPLRYDSEFFHLLNQELSGLQDLQSHERSKLTNEIGALGREISTLAAPSHGAAKSDFYIWREILTLYTECSVFFSTNEREQFQRNSSTAQIQLKKFSEKMSEIKVAKRLRRRESHIAMDRFLHINTILFRNLKFQELNATAMTKILKKFDKRTALRVQQTFLDFISSESLSSQSLAKAMCFQISGEVISLIPQLNDYLCPVCFNISFKPIRLECGHVFCIRCMIVLQKAKQDHCPLCRSSGVMQADSANLDPALMNFLEKYFPVEVKRKQRENERNMGIDRYGEEYAKCLIM